MPIPRPNSERCGAGLNRPCCERDRFHAGAATVVDVVSGMLTENPPPKPIRRGVRRQFPAGDVSDENVLRLYSGPLEERHFLPRRPPGSAAVTPANALQHVPGGVTQPERSISFSTTSLSFSAARLGYLAVGEKRSSISFQDVMIFAFVFIAVCTLLRSVASELSIRS